MTKTIDQALSAFVDDWNAGRRPDLDDHLETVTAGDRPELATLVSTFLEHAPTPPYDAAALAALEADPALVAARERLLGPALGALVRERRAARKLSVGALATRIGTAVGIAGRDGEIEGYLERLERDELDGSRLSSRLLDALASALDSARDAVESAAAATRPAPAGALFRMGAGADPADVLPRLEAIADAIHTTTPAGNDDVDDLFLGGR